MARNRLFSSLLGLGMIAAIAGGGAASVTKAEEAGERLKDSFLLTGDRMLKVFAPAAAKSRQATVRLLQDDGVQVALGTVVDADGWILSKASQAHAATQTEFANGRRLPIEFAATEQQHDLALFRIEAEDLTPVVWRDAAPITGEWLISPGIADLPVAVGVMSLERRKVSRSSTHGYLGVEVDREKTPRIRRVLPNSGASAAGLEPGDVVLEVNQLAIGTGDQLVKTLKDFRPGDTLAIRVQRDEEEIAFRVTLTHPLGEFLSRMAFQNQLGGDLSYRRDDFEAVYQHDSVLRPDECGGPVVALDGQVVGINIARAGRTETYILPADLIHSVLEQLKQNAAAPMESSVAAPPPEEDMTSESLSDDFEESAPEPVEQD